MTRYSPAVICRIRGSNLSTYSTQKLNQPWQSFTLPSSRLKPEDSKLQDGASSSPTTAAPQSPSAKPSRADAALHLVPSPPAALPYRPIGSCRTQTGSPRSSLESVALPEHHPYPLACCCTARHSFTSPLPPSSIPLGQVPDLKPHLSSVSTQGLDITEVAGIHNGLSPIGILYRT